MDVAATRSQPCEKEEAMTRTKSTGKWLRIGAYLAVGGCAYLLSGASAFAAGWNWGPYQGWATPGSNGYCDSVDNNGNPYAYGTSWNRTSPSVQVGAFMSPMYNAGGFIWAQSFNQNGQYTDAVDTYIGDGTAWTSTNSTILGHRCRAYGWW
jgi:hypothetical protein